jgi:hypothetical protein
MDFVNLANDVSQITEALLRHLTVIQQDENTGDTGSTHGPATTAPQQYQYYSPEEDMSDVPISTPFLSPTAENELYLLATNFLLCKLPQL